MNGLPGTVTGTRVNDHLVVSLPSDLSGEVLEQVRQMTLHQVRSDRLGVVIFECTAVRYMDVHEFTELHTIADVITVLGAQTIFVGLRPGIVKHLVLSDVDLSRVRAFLGLNEALDYLARTSAR